VFAIVGLSGADGFEVVGWYAAPDFVGWYLGVLQDEGSGGDDAALADLAAVEEGGAHADEGVVADGAGVDGDVMTDGDIGADVGGSGVVGDVDAGAVLHVGAVADGDGGDVATHDGIEPHGTLVTQGDIADKGGILAEIAVATPAGRLA